MGKSDYLENEVLKWCSGVANALDDGLIVPWVGLFTTLPNDAGSGGVEVSGGSYARVNTSGKWGSPSAGVMSNSAVITFPLATANWGTIVGFGLWNASSAGNLLRYYSLVTNKTVNTDDPASFAIGALILRED